MARHGARTGAVTNRNGDLPLHVPDTTVVEPGSPSQVDSGRALIVKKGHRIRVAGRSVVDFVAFNFDDLTERFDQARTKTNQVKIFIGKGDQLISKLNNPMLTIVEDTFKEGRHDLQKGMCSRKRFELVAKGLAKRVFTEGIDPNPKTAEQIPDHGCWENLTDG